MDGWLAGGARDEHECGARARARRQEWLNAGMRETQGFPRTAVMLATHRVAAYLQCFPPSQAKGTGDADDARGRRQQPSVHKAKP